MKSMIFMSLALLANWCCEQPLAGDVVLRAGAGGGEKGKWAYEDARKNHRIIRPSLRIVDVIVVGKTCVHVS